MNESLQIGAYRKQLHYRLLLTVSSVALLTSAVIAQEAEAADNDRPTVWIEVGGAFDQISAGDFALVAAQLDTAYFQSSAKSVRKIAVDRI